MYYTMGLLYLKFAFGEVYHRTFGQKCCFTAMWKWSNQTWFLFVYPTINLPKWFFFNMVIWRPFCSAEWNHLCNFGRGYHEQFCEIMFFYSDQCFRRCHFKDFLSRALASLLLAEQNHLCNFGRGQYGEHSCEIILYLDKWFTKRCHLR